MVSAAFKYIPQDKTGTTFAFSSVFILLLCSKVWDSKERQLCSLPQPHHNFWIPNVFIIPSGWKQFFIFNHCQAILVWQILLKKVKAPNVHIVLCSQRNNYCSHLLYYTYYSKLIVGQKINPYCLQQHAKVHGAVLGFCAYKIYGELIYLWELNIDFSFIFSSSLH